MAKITKRMKKDGTCSYCIRVSNGYDRRGRQVMVNRTFTPPPGMTGKKLEKELQRQADAFEQEVHAGVLLDEVNFSAYAQVLGNSKLARWYLNSVLASSIITVIVLLIGMMCAYALSQLRFPGRKALYLMIVASFMVPVPALYVAQFVLMNDLGLVNTLWGIILPELIVPDRETLPPARCAAASA